MNRVELHTHTKYSEMDGLIDIRELLAFAETEGMQAVAVTDHANIDVISESEKIVREMKKEGILSKEFKVIYGTEVYLVDDLTTVAINENGQSLFSDVVIIDIETTGLSPECDSIIEVGAVKLSNGKIIDSFYTLVNPENKVPADIIEITGFNDDMLKEQPLMQTVLLQLLDFIGDSILVGHNVMFDANFISVNAQRIGRHMRNTLIDTVALGRLLLPDIKNYRLISVADALDIDYENADSTMDYVKLNVEIYNKFVKQLSNAGINNWKQVNEQYIGNADVIKCLPRYHATVLVRNQKGLENLYKILEVANEHYYKIRPRVPKSLLEKHREGLLVGSACEAGMLYRSVVSGMPEKDCIEIAKFFDYLEIQPLSNNRFMIEDTSYRNINSEEDLKRANQKIVKIGKLVGIPVVATCDAHYLYAEDLIGRIVLRYYQGFEDSFEDYGLYVRNTEEMINEFQYLGEQIALDVVVNNTNKIADMIESNWFLAEPIKCVKRNNDMMEITEVDAEKILREFEEDYGKELGKKWKHRVVQMLSGLKELRDE